VPRSLVFVDTSAWILALRQADGPAPSRVDGLLEQDVVATAAPVVLELLSGTKTEAEYRRLEERMSALHQVPIVPATWSRAARLGFDLRRNGVTVPHMDLLIASAALSISAVLLHADSDYDRIAAHSDLIVESVEAT